MGRTRGSIRWRSLARNGPVGARTARTFVSTLPTAPVASATARRKLRKLPEATGTEASARSSPAPPAGGWSSFGPDCATLNWIYVGLNISELNPCDLYRRPELYGRSRRAPRPPASTTRRRSPEHAGAAAGACCQSNLELRVDLHACSRAARVCDDWCVRQQLGRARNLDAQRGASFRHALPGASAARVLEHKADVSCACV